MSDAHVTAVIPALNEAQTIPDVVAGVRSHADEVLVIDDGSTDDTAASASAAGAVVHEHETTQGYDKSINDGFRLASERGATIVFTFDADGQHNPHDIPTLLDPVASGAVDMGIGCRPRKARVSEKLFTAYTRARFGVEDPLCGFKVYRTEIYNQVGHFDTHSMIGTQLLIEAIKRGYEFEQHPIRINERDGDSRFGDQLKSNWKILRALMKAIWVDVTTTPSPR